MINKLEKPAEMKSWPGKIPLHNVYTVGVANERFLRTIQKDGKLTAASCTSCKKDFVPPKMFCPFCMSELTEWKDVSAKGKVETFTVSNIDIRGNKLSAPQVFAFIRLSSAGGLIHKIAEITPDKVEIGLEVEAVFKPAADRKGSINDIQHFRPAR